MRTHTRVFEFVVFDICNLFPHQPTKEGDEPNGAPKIKHPLMSDVPESRALHVMHGVCAGACALKCEVFRTSQVHWDAGGWRRLRAHATADGTSWLFFLAVMSVVH